MRYWHPFTAEAVEQLRAADCDQVVLLPLYPQYSSTTTGSSLNEWRKHFAGGIPVHTIDAFYRHDIYLESLVEKIEEGLAASRILNNPSWFSVPTAFRSQLSKKATLISVKSRKRYAW